jgi:formate dehydrogenase iron-sulfur subunit
MTSSIIDADHPRTLIDELLEEQQSLTAVDRFTRTHEHSALPSQSRYYQDLIPLSKPERGEQYAFAVDLDLCTGCKACVSACHSLNGLDQDEIWRNVGLIHGGATEEPYQQTVTTACHHCVEPGCLLGCPVRAYEKDVETGIVRHLDDQCIGCQYCVLKCPYDVPKYSKSRGIVRKCDMCYGRLKVGEAPACVQACPSGAITIRIVPQAEWLESIAPGDSMLPGAFDSAYTKPTTAYTTRHMIPANARSGDDSALRLEHAHWPLIGMLVLSQAAAGIFLGAATLAAESPATFNAARAPLTIGAFALLNLGLAVSVLHLGRPLGAWRAFLGLGTSWMSREIFAFGLFATAAAGLVGACLWDWAASMLPKLHLLEVFGSPAQLAVPIAFVTAALGLLGVFCSAMIYVDTHRSFWNRPMVFTKFFGTTALLGAAGTSAILASTGAFASRSPWNATAKSAILFLLIRTALLGWEFVTLKQMVSDSSDPNHRSGRIIWNLLRAQMFGGLTAIAASMIFSLFAIVLAGAPAAVCASLAFLFACVSQGVERYFFFTAVVALRMPGPLLPEPHSHA